MTILEFAYAVGVPCPECGKPMTYDAGEPMSREHPGEPESVGCGNCGTTHPPRRNQLGDLHRLDLDRRAHETHWQRTDGSVYAVDGSD